MAYGDLVFLNSIQIAPEGRMAAASPLRGEFSIAEASLAPFLSLMAIVALAHSFFRRARSKARDSVPNREPSAPEIGPEPFSEDSAPTIDSLDVLPLRYCPICHSTYLPHTEECEECCVELQDEPDEDPQPPSIGRDSTVRIARISDPIHCNLVVARLQNEGIPCVVSQAPVLGHHGGDLFVLLSDAFHAKRLVREYLAELEKECSQT
jgi:hypothetical protein